MTGSSGRRLRRRTCRSRSSSCRPHVHPLSRRWLTVTTLRSMRRRATPWSAVRRGRVGATPRQRSCLSARRRSQSEWRLHADRTADRRPSARRLRFRRTATGRVAGWPRLAQARRSVCGRLLSWRCTRGPRAMQQRLPSRRNCLHRRISSARPSTRLSKSGSSDTTSTSMSLLPSPSRRAAEPKRPASTGRMGHSSTVLRMRLASLPQSPC